MISTVPLNTLVRIFEATLPNVPPTPSTPFNIFILFLERQRIFKFFKPPKLPIFSIQLDDNDNLVQFTSVVSLSSWFSKRLTFNLTYVASIFSIGGMIPLRTIWSDSAAFVSCFFSHCATASLSEVPLLIFNFSNLHF